MTRLLAKLPAAADWKMPCCPVGTTTMIFVPSVVISCVTPTFPTRESLTPLTKRPWADEQEIGGLDEASEAVDALVGDRAIVPCGIEVAEAQAEQPAEIQKALTATPITLPPEEPSAARSDAAVGVVVARDAPAESEASSSLRAITPALPIIPIKQTAKVSMHEQPPESPAESPDATPHTGEEIPGSDSGAGALVMVEKSATQTQSVPDAGKQSGLRSSSEAEEKAEATAPAAVWTKVGSGGTTKAAKDAVKRSPPGKLDIMAATRELIRETQALSALGAAKTSSQKKPITSAGRTPASAPNPRLPPAKTLRVVATPKLSTPQDKTRGIAIAAGDTASSAAASQTHKSSAASTQVPATPVTDNPSELGSGTPGLLSRANSPPPARGGAEATRESSKAFRKKQRQEAKKQMKAKEQEKKITEKKEAARKEPDDLLVSKVTDEEVAPIIGRKKKKPKPRPSRRDVPATPISRPSSPVPGEIEPAKDDGRESEPSGAVDAKEPAESAKPIEKNLGTHADGKKDSEIETQVLKPEEDVAKESRAGSGPTARSDASPSDEFLHLTPAMIMTSLVAEGELDPATLAFFNPAPGFGKTLEHSLADQDAHIRKSITLPKHRAHLEGGGLGAGGGGAVRTRESLREHVPQSGSVVRGLDPGQDARLAELEQRVLEMGEAEQRALLAILNQTMASASSSSATDGVNTSEGWNTMAAAALSGKPPSVTVNLPPLSTSLLSASSSAVSVATNAKDQQAGAGSGSGISLGTSLASGLGLGTTVNNPYRTTPTPSTTILTIPFGSHNSDNIPNSSISNSGSSSNNNSNKNNKNNNGNNDNSNSDNFIGQLEDLARKVKDAESQLAKHATEGEQLEKRLMALILHNRRLVGLS